MERFLCDMGDTLKMRSMYSVLLCWQSTNICFLRNFLPCLMF
jgi:hypothetical protein